MEFEALDGVAEMFEAAEAEAEALAMGEGEEVEENAAVQEMADGPAIEADNLSTTEQIKNFIQNNPYGSRIWAFSKWAVKSAASASAAFGVMYGLNKAVAKNASTTGNRTALSVYLQGLANNWAKQDLGTFTDKMREKAAEDALAYPWIDATQ